MKAMALGMFIIGYALFYTGASNMFSGGHGWGFLQALLNKGTANQSGSVPNLLGNGKEDKSGGSSLGDLFKNIPALPGLPWTGGLGL